MAVRYGVAKTVQCMHCGADNPSTAYCCLNCFKVMKEKPKSSFWSWRFKPTWTSVSVIFAVTFILGLLLRKWMESIEAQITMNFQSADYSLVLQADKKKKKLAAESSVESQPPLDENNQVSSGPQ